MMWVPTWPRDATFQACTSGCSGGSPQSPSPPGPATYPSSVTPICTTTRLIRTPSSSATHRPSLATRPPRVLRVGFMSSAANEAAQQIVAAFGRRRPGWRVDLQQAAWSDPTAGLARGDVDAALLRLPFPGQDDVRIEVLLTEPRWVALPATHPLAARDQISFHQLWDEPFVAAPAETGWWRDYWLATGERH